MVVVDFPLVGEWTAPHTPADRVPSHGTTLWAQSYAYDFLRVNPSTRRFHRRSHLRHLTTGVALADCHGFGAPVSSAFSGTVVRSDDSMPDVEPVHLVRDLARVVRNAVRPRGWPEPWAVCGNHVIVRHRDGCHALYAHLRQGSVAVTAGQEIAAGDRIGEVGHTGNSTAPHLHFQLMTTQDPTTAEPIPCAFRRYELLRNGRWEPQQHAIPPRNDLIRSTPASDGS